MRIVLIDTSALVHRAYHALPDFRTKTGEPSGAVYGFCSMFLKLIQELRPEGVVAALDLPVMTFRKKLFPEYQAQRPEKKPDFKTQLERIKEFLSLVRIPLVSQPGYEGDDVIGSLAEVLSQDKENEIIILTGDNDSLQLVKPRVKVLTLKKGITETVLYDEKAVKERFGFEPRYLPDYKALAGDNSDNIPGLPGVGPKTATKLIQEFGGLEEIITAAQQGKLEANLREKILSHLDQLRLAKDLATIRTNLKVDPGKLSFDPSVIYSEATLAFFNELGFVSLIKRIGESYGVESISFSGKEKEVEVSLKELPLETLLTKLKTHQRIFLLFGEGSEVILSEGKGFCFLNKEELKKLLLESPTWEKVVFDLKAELRRHNDEDLIKGFTQGKIWDLKLISWLIDPEFKNYQLERLGRRFLGRAGKSESVSEKEKLIFELDSLVKLFEKLTETLRQENLEKLYLEIEAPLILVLLKMERNGILFDQSALRKTETFFETKITALEKKIFQLAGQEFNLHSPKELSRVLYSDLGLPKTKVRKLKSGYYSTDSETLLGLKNRHPVVELILEWRELAKLQDTYLKALPRFVDKKDQRIHTVFLQTGTATGRLASESPNLQNIPKHVDLAQEIRKLFISEPGFSLVSFDYSQIELRLAANLSGDEVLRQAFLANQDIHRLTASLVWGIPLAKVTALERFRAKALNFGVLYGMGARTLSKTANLSLDQAKKFIESYFKNFVGLKKYIDETLAFLRANGYVQTQFGRKRYFPEIFSGKTQLVSQAERMALNLTVQGLAADIIKKAMIKIDQELTKRQLTAQVRLVLQIHDELLFEIKDEIINQVVPLIKKIMEEIYPAEVPLKVEVGQGKNWAEIT